MLKPWIIRHSTTCSRPLSSPSKKKHKGGGINPLLSHRAHYADKDYYFSFVGKEDDGSTALEGEDYEQSLISDHNNIFKRILHKKRCTPLPIRERVADVKPLLPALSAGTPFFEDMKQPEAFGNEELAKISNFLHLSPPMVEAHTKHLKELCTACPERPKRPVKIYKTNYAFVGPSMKQPMSRNVSIKVDVNDLDLKEEDRPLFEGLVTAHPKDDFLSYHRVGKHPRIKAAEFPVLTKLEGSTLTITGQQCPTRDQNINMCFYRLSGFLDEAPKLQPITKSFTISNNVIAFVCGMTEREVLKFFSDRHTMVQPDGDGSIQITGTEAAVTALIEQLAETVGNITETQLDVPPQFSEYIQYEGQGMWDILSEYDMLLTPDNIVVGHSHLMEQCVQDIAEYIAKLILVEMDLDPRYSFKLLSDDFFERKVNNLKCIVEVSPSGHLKAILEDSPNVEALEMITQKVMGEIEKSSVTRTVEECDFEIPKHITDAMNVYVEHTGSTATVTGHPESVKDFVSFVTTKRSRILKNKTNFLKT